MSETVSIGPPTDGPRPPRSRPGRRTVAIVCSGVALAVVLALVAGVASGVIRLPRTSYSSEDVIRTLERTAPSMLRPTAARWDPQRVWWGAEWAGDLRVARGDGCMLLWHLITIPGGQQRTGGWFDRAVDGWGARDLSPIQTHRSAIYRFTTTEDAIGLTDRVQTALDECDEMVVTDAWGMYPERSIVDGLPLTPTADAPLPDDLRLVGFTQSGQWKMTYFTIVVGQRHNVVTVDVVAGNDQAALTGHVLGFWRDLG